MHSPPNAHLALRDVSEVFHRAGRIFRICTKHRSITSAMRGGTVIKKWSIATCRTIVAEKEFIKQSELP